MHFFKKKCSDEMKVSLIGEKAEMKENLHSFYQGHHHHFLSSFKDIIPANYSDPEIIDFFL